MEPITSLAELEQKARAVESGGWRDLALIASNNLGGPDDDLDRALQWLKFHVRWLVSEGMDEAEAEKMTCDEVNGVLRLFEEELANTERKSNQ